MSGSAKILAWSRVHRSGPSADARDVHKPRWRPLRVFLPQFSAPMSGVVVNRVSRWRVASSRRSAIGSSSCEGSIPDVRQFFWKTFFVSLKNSRIVLDL